MWVRVPSHRKGKSRFKSENERKEAHNQSVRKYKAKIKLINN